MSIAGIVLGELAVVVGVVEQAVARPGVAAHGLVGDEDLVRGTIDVVGVRAHGEGRRHGAAAGGAAHDVEGEARLQHRLVEADVGRTVGAAAAGDEAERRAADEAVEPLDVAHIVERDVVVHGDVAGRQPARRAGDGCVRLVQQDQALRVRRQQLGGQPLQRIGLLVGGMQTDGEHEVGLPDRLLRPGRQLRLGDEQHIVAFGLERIEHPRRLGAVDADRRRQHRLGHLRPHQDGAVAAPECPRQADDEGRGQLARAGTNERDGARARVGRRLPADVGRGHAPCHRHGQRAPDRRALGRQRLELGPPQPQHQAVAQRGDGGGARAPGEEGDLADRLARTQLRDRLAPAFDGDRESARDDDIERLRHLALAHQHLATPQVERLELGGQARALLLLEIVKDLDPVEAVLGNLRFHLCSGAWALPRAPYPNRPRQRTCGAERRKGAKAAPGRPGCHPGARRRDPACRGLLSRVASTTPRRREFVDGMTPSSTLPSWREYCAFPRCWGKGILGSARRAMVHGGAIAKTARAFVCWRSEARGFCLFPAISCPHVAIHSISSPAPARCPGRLLPSSTRPGPPRAACS